MKTSLPLLLVVFSLFAAPAATATGITFSFANGTVSGDKYQFDVMVQASAEGARIGEVLVYIDYSATAFGSDIVAQSRVSVSKGSLIDIGNYLLNFNDTGTGPRISIGTQFVGPADYGSALTTSPAQLFRVEIDIQDATAAAGLSFWLEQMDGQQFMSDLKTLFVPVSAANNDNSVLPVELAAFSAMLDSDGVSLSWTTSSETNNAGFEVEHAAPRDSSRFERVGFVAGKGTTSSTSQYHFQTGSLEHGTHRFRLKQVDFDGTFAYSPVVEVVVELAESFGLSPAYPNPFNPQTSFELSLREGQQVSVFVYNTIGQRVATLHEGYLSGGAVHLFRFDAGTLPSGLYFIRVAGDHFHATRQVSLIK